MTSGPAPICMYCKHYRKNTEGLICAAFPGGIPEGILTSNVDHRQPIEGDHGIQFEPLTEAGRIYAEELLAKVALA